MQKERRNIDAAFLNAELLVWPIQSSVFIVFKGRRYVAVWVDVWNTLEACKVNYTCPASLFPFLGGF